MRILLACLLLGCCFPAFSALLFKPASGDSTRVSVVPSARPVSDPIILPEILLADSSLYFRAKAQEYQEEVIRRNALVGNLNDVFSLELPVGLLGKERDQNYTIIISDIHGDVRGAVLEAYFMFELPNTGDKIAFRGRNIKFTYDGALTGTGRLDLIGSYPIKLNDNTLFTLSGKGNLSDGNAGTFVEFDCNGFRNLSIEGEVEFSRDLIIPEDNAGNLMAAPQRVKTSVVVQTQDWNDMLVGVTLPPFQLSGLNGVGFSVKQAYLDWSDLANPSGLIFPPGYTSPFIAAAQPALWTGIFCQRLEVRLPPSFKKGGPSENARIVLGGENMILDERGFSGRVFAENVLTAGTMGGWAYTINKLALDLALNEVRSFEFDGNIAIPKIKSRDNTPAWFGYMGQRSADGSYVFAVKVAKEVSLPLLAAELNLFQGSSITVREHDNQFYPTAILNGDLTIKNIPAGVKPGFSGIRFEGMRISAVEPRFDILAVGFGGNNQQSVSGYPVVISQVEVKKNSSRIGLHFTCALNLGGKADDEGFGGSATLTVWGKEGNAPVKNPEGQPVGTEAEWIFDKVEMSGVGIKINKPGIIELAGNVLFFDSSAVYGDGFKGTLKGKIQNMAVDANALFGKTAAFRYWYADALVEFKNGVPLAPGLSAYGFGGGYFSKMKQTTEKISGGFTQSGITYLPDENTSGIQALVTLGTAGRPEPFNGDLMLEVIQNRHGGINSIAFQGIGKFMTPLLQGYVTYAREKFPQMIQDKSLFKSVNGTAQEQVFGSVLLLFDNVNNVFHGNIEVYVNVAGGLLRGVSAGNKAGWATLHFAPSEWYIQLGSPTQPLGLEFLRFIKSQSYFMMGDNLPGSPPPPPQAAELLPGTNLDYARDLNLLASAGGFAFGSSFIVDTGDLRFLMFYGRFAAGAGFDIMLKNFGVSAHCAESQEPLGINGWYATGQAYAFIHGKIGVKVNLKFYKGNYDILNIGAAAVMQVTGPNPFWLNGTVGGHYKILGGLVKGHCKFEVTVGKRCNPVKEEAILADVRMIAGISPVNLSKEVDVFTAPQVAFNVPINEVFEITDEKNMQHAFRVSLDHFVVEESGNPLAGDLQWNDNRDVVIFNAQDILPGQKNLKAKAQITFEERINGGWNKVRLDGKLVSESIETTFTTGQAPDYIPPQNVAVSYPASGQLNFHTQEYDQGFIQLRMGQPYLFNPGPDWIQKIRMTATGGHYVEGDFSYLPSEKKISFRLPAGLTNASVYQFEILSIPRQRTVVDANVQKVETELNPVTAGTATLTTKQIEGNLANLEIKTIYSNTFRTSQYATFVEKMRATQLAPAFRDNRGSNIFFLSSLMKGTEMFDRADLTGVSPLIRMEAILAGNNWYENHVYPLVYEGYPLLSRMLVQRASPDVVGIPPVRDIRVETYNTTLPGGANETSFAERPFTSERLTYRLGEPVAFDFWDLRNQVASYVAFDPSRMTSRLEMFITKPMPYLRYGSYKVRLHYVIPGINRTTSYFDCELFNPIPDND